MARILDRQKEAYWVRQAQAGNPDSFGRLYDSYIRKIYDFIYYKTMNKEVAEDLTSDCFIKAWKNIGRFESGSFSAWLYTIARNSVIDHYRSRKELVDIEECWDLSDGYDPIARFDSDIRLGSIKSAMRELSVEERELVIMRLWLGFSFREIAEQLGKKEGAVKMSFGRTIVRLRKKVPLAMVILVPVIINICKKMN